MEVEGEMTTEERTGIRESLKRQKLLFDGAFGTYYGNIYGTRELPEVANTKYPQRVLDWQGYIDGNCSCC